MSRDMLLYGLRQIVAAPGAFSDLWSFVMQEMVDGTHDSVESDEFMSTQRLHNGPGINVYE